MALYIYPRLCRFREKYAHYGVPGCLCYDEEGNHIDIDEASKNWMAILDKMILAFKYIINEPDWKDIEECRAINAKIEEGLKLFAEYYCSLWY